MRCAQRASRTSYGCIDTRNKPEGPIRTRRETAHHELVASPRLAHMPASRPRISLRALRVAHRQVDERPNLRPPSAHGPRPGKPGPMLLASWWSLHHGKRHGIGTGTPEQVANAVVRDRARQVGNLRGSGPSAGTRPLHDAGARDLRASGGLGRRERARRDCRGPEGRTLRRADSTTLCSNGFRGCPASFRRFG